MYDGFKKIPHVEVYFYRSQMSKRFCASLQVTWWWPNTAMKNATNELKMNQRKNGSEAISVQLEIHFFYAMFGGSNLDFCWCFTPYSMEISPNSLIYIHTTYAGLYSGWRSTTVSYLQTRVQSPKSQKLRAHQIIQWGCKKSKQGSNDSPQVGGHMGRKKRQYSQVRGQKNVKNPGNHEVNITCLYHPGIGLWHTRQPHLVWSPICCPIPYRTMVYGGVWYWGWNSSSYTMPIIPVLLHLWIINNHWINPISHIYNYIYRKIWISSISSMFIVSHSKYSKYSSPVPTLAVPPQQCQAPLGWKISTNQIC